MGFVLEEQKPRLGFAVNLYIHFNRAGVDLLGLVKLIELTLFSEVFHCKRCNIHKVYRLSPAKLFSCFNIVVIGLLNKAVLKLNVVDSSQERCVTAMIRPVGVDHTDLGYSGISLFEDKILLTESNVVLVHSKTVFAYKIGKLRFTVLAEPVESFNLGRYGIVGF